MVHHCNGILIVFTDSVVCFTNSHSDHHPQAKNSKTFPLYGYSPLHSFDQPHLHISNSVGGFEVSETESSVSDTFPITQPSLTNTLQYSTVVQFHK